MRAKLLKNAGGCLKRLDHPHTPGLKHRSENLLRRNEELQKKLMIIGEIGASRAGKLQCTRFEFRLMQFFTFEKLIHLVHAARNERAGAQAHRHPKSKRSTSFGMPVWSVRLEV